MTRFKLNNRSKAKLWASIAKLARNPSLVKTSNKKSHKKINRGWREIGGRKVYCRSQWEANYAFYLQWQKSLYKIEDWEHEPKTFWFEGIKRGCVTYLPDFKVIHLDGSHEWVEVKGHMDAKSCTKLKRFEKYFPEERLRLVGAKWYRENSPKLSKIIPGWES